MNNVISLRGRRAISYLRFSSAPQEKGSTIERQQGILTSLLERYGLILDHALMDKALSASKGHHRKRGKLGDLLKAIDAGIMPPDMVLIIEAIDRLFREGLFDALPVLKTIIRTGGMPIVTGDGTIWDEDSINSPMVHKLIAEVNAAYEYAKRLSELARGAHAKRRHQLEATFDDPNAAMPLLNSPPPGWIVKAGDHYEPHIQHAATLRRMFSMYREGNSIRQIAATFNHEGVPHFPCARKIQADDWFSPRIAQILRDERAIGFYQPCVRQANGTRIERGRKVRVYPAAIDAADWLAVQGMLESHTSRKGRKGMIENLFTGKCFCATCGGTMRVEAGGHIRANGTRQRNLVCVHYTMAQTCKDGTRYDMHYFEQPILFDLVAMHSTFANRPKDDRATKRIADELALLKIEMKTLDESITALAPRIGASTSLAARVEQMSVQLDEMQRVAARKESELDAASLPTRRGNEKWDFFMQSIMPAVSGDVAARERMRGLLGSIDFKLRGDGAGNLLIEYEGETRQILNGSSSRRRNHATELHADATKKRPPG